MSSLAAALAAIQINLEERIAKNLSNGIVETVALPGYEIELLHDISALLAASGAAPATADNQVLEIAELEAINTRLDIPLTDLLTELQAINAGDATAANQALEIAELQGIATQLDVPLTDLLTAIQAITPGDATAANQVLEIAELQGIATQLDVPLTDLLTAIQAITPGDATAANQVLEIAELEAINTRLDIPLTDLLAELQAINAGDATAANQALEIAELQGIATQLDIPLTDLLTAIQAITPGDATAANQALEIAELQTVNSQLDTPLSNLLTELQNISTDVDAIPVITDDVGQDSIRIYPGIQQNETIEFISPLTAINQEYLIKYSVYQRLTIQYFVTANPGDSITVVVEFSCNGGSDFTNLDRCDKEYTLDTSGNYGFIETDVEADMIRLRVVNIVGSAQIDRAYFKVR